MKVQLLVLISIIILLFVLACDTTPTGKEKEEIFYGSLSGCFLQEHYDNFSYFWDGSEDIKVLIGEHTLEPYDNFDISNQTTTDSYGRFVIENIPVGLIDLEYKNLWGEYINIDDISIKPNFNTEITNIYLQGRFLIFFGNLTGVEPDSFNLFVYENHDFNWSIREYFAQSYYIKFYSSQTFELKYPAPSKYWINDSLFFRFSSVSTNNLYRKKNILFLFHNSNKCIYNVNINLSNIPFSNFSDPFIINLY